MQLRCHRLRVRRVHRRDHYGDEAPRGTRTSLQFPESLFACVIGEESNLHNLAVAKSTISKIKLTALSIPGPGVGTGRSWTGPSSRGMSLGRREAPVSPSVWRLGPHQPPQHREGPRERAEDAGSHANRPESHAADCVLRRTRPFACRTTSAAPRGPRFACRWSSSTRCGTRFACRRDLFHMRTGPFYANLPGSHTEGVLLHVAGLHSSASPPAVRREDPAKDLDGSEKRIRAPGSNAGPGSPNVVPHCGEDVGPGGTIEPSRGGRWIRLR